MRVHAHREANVLATLTLAFSSDPANRWCWPGTADYLAAFPQFVRALGGGAFAAECAFEIAGGAGAALWLPPGVEPDEAELIAIVQRTVHASRQNDLYEVMQQMGRFHPSEPHWYLPLMGIDPLRQGQGRGSALIRHALVPVDTDRRPAYLESTNPKNVPLYQRHGFELLGTVQVGSSPPIFPMLRPARGQ